MNQTKPHKHAAVIKAWADGKQIQAAEPVSPTRTDPLGQREPIWRDVDWPCPTFAPESLYRVKPATTKVRLRTAAMSSGAPSHQVGELAGIWTAHATTEKGAAEIEACADFICWLHDWKEIERPEPIAVDQAEVDPEWPTTGFDLGLGDIASATVWALHPDGQIRPTGVFEFKGNRLW